MTIKNNDQLELHLSYVFEHGVNFKERVILIVEEINDELYKLVESAMTEMESYSRQPITLKINSGGGDEYAALAIVGRIKRSKCKVITEGYGQIMSAATLILAAGRHRRISKYATFMHHESSYELEGRHTSIKAELAEHERMEQVWAQCMADMSSKSKKFYLEEGKNTDKYWTPSQLKEYGIVDEIIWRQRISYVKLSDLKRAKAIVSGSSEDQPSTASYKPTKSELEARFKEYLKKKHNVPITYVQKYSHTPSGFGTKCYRKIYYNYFKIAKDSKTDAKTAGIFETGNYYELMILDWLKAMGEHIPYLDPKTGQIPVDRHGKPNAQFPLSIKDWRIRKGYIDNVAIVNGKLYIYEVKSSNSFKFGELTEPMDDHKTQITCYYKAMEEGLNDGTYAHIPQLEGFTKVDGIMVIYINKDDSTRKIFEISPATLEGYVKTTQEKVIKADTFIQSHTLPPKTPDKCSWCNWAAKCSKNFNEIPLAAEPA